MSVVTIGPSKPLDGAVPVPPRYGLLSVATIVDDGDLHYLAGGEIWPYPDRESGDVHDPLSTGTTRTKAGPQTLPTPEFGSYTVYETIGCTARAISNQYDEWASRAVAALQAVESTLVEEEFATGLRLPLNPHLGDANVNVVDNTGLGPVEALARLERSAAVRGTLPVIHADPATVVAWVAARVVEPSGNLLRSIASGAPVVNGYGYVGAVPAGEAALGATEGWAFATGPVQARRTGVTVLPGSAREAMDRSDNYIEMRAERDYLVVWDTVLQDAILVDRSA